MAKILSQEEVDALLNSLSGSPAEKPAAPAHGAPPPSHPAERKKVAIYNFRRPDRVNKEQIRSLHFLHDRFARNISTSLSLSPNATISSKVMPSASAKARSPVALSIVASQNSTSRS